MKKILIITAIIIGLLFALLQILAMLSAGGLGEKMVRATFAGIILLVIAIGYQRRKRPTDSGN